MTVQPRMSAADWRGTLPERSFQAWVIDTARLNGWLVWHFSDSRREVRVRDGGSRLVGDAGARGWPDLALAHHGRRLFMVRELKTDRGRLTCGQRDTLAVLEAAGVDVGVWRPKDSDLIERSLGDATNGR